jgi:pantetheine-phosphate adenylyltransferase
MKTAIYPGTFDPITYGHIDVIKKSLNIFDRVIVATTDNVNKSYYFSISERLDIINNSLFKDLKLNKNKIKVVSFNNLTIDLCKKLNTNIETMFLMSDVENQIISSKFVKEIASLGGNINRFVTKYTVKMLKNKF